MKMKTKMGESNFYFYFLIPILFIFCVIWIFVVLITEPFLFFFVHRFGHTILTSSTGASNLWPLIAVCHQMTVRDAVPLQEQSDDLISQIRFS